jgi:hypothetical protein
MAMVLRKGFPLLATIRAEAEALFITEWVDWQAQDNCIEDGNLKVDLLSLNEEHLILIEVIFLFILLAGFLSTLIGRFVAVELLNLAVDYLLNGI